MGLTMGNNTATVTITDILHQSWPFHGARDIHLYFNKHLSSAPGLFLCNALTTAGTYAAISHWSGAFSLLEFGHTLKRKEKKDESKLCQYSYFTSGNVSDAETEVHNVERFITYAEYHIYQYFPYATL